MSEYTLGIIKPGAVAAGHAEAATADIQAAGFRIAQSAVQRWTQPMAQTFYAEHEGKPFFSDLIAHAISGPCVAMRLEFGNGLGTDLSLSVSPYQPWRDLIGPTDPTKRLPHHLRHKYGGSGVANGFHGSDKFAAALRELHLVFGDSLDVKLDHPAAKPPTRGYVTDAGLDVYASQDAVVQFGCITVVHLGFAVAIPPGFEIQLRPRSGLGRLGLTIINSPGTIDAGYRGEMVVQMTSCNKQHGTETPYRIQAGDKVAQMVLAPVVRMAVLQVEELPAAARGVNGFGSTGT